MLSSSTTLDGGRSRAGAGAGAPPWLAPLALAVAAGLLYAVNLDRLPHPDELHHAIAARGLLADGTPSIAEGVYTRTLLHTWMVAGAYALFGDGLAVARLPSLLCVAALVALLFAWLRREAGGLAAWIGAGLFAVSPFAVDTAQFARFYAPQCLALFAAAVLLHAAVLDRARGPHRRLLLAGLALPPLLLAVYFQPTSLIGMTGIGAWAVGALALPWLADGAVPARRRLAWSLGALALGLLVLLVAWQAGILADLWRRYRWTPLFNQDTQDQFWFYHGWFSLLYPTLWPLTGVLGLVAVVARPRAGAFALTVFALAFLLNSVAAAKSLRYIVYAQPFLFAVWGIALAASWPPLRGFLAGVRRELGDGLAELGRPYRPLSWVLAAGALLFLLLANPAWLRTGAILADVTVPPEQPMADWPRARPALESWLRRAGVVVTTEELATLYYLGRFDVRFSRSKLAELDDAEQKEFGIDFRTGRPVISTAESVARLFACYPSGLVLGPRTSWNNPKLIDAATARLIEERARPIDLPPGTHMFAYGWERPAGAPPPPDCADLPRLPQSPSAAAR
jgi:4-amino-4-deoxy-L-arabinose transferase-like glycosyltransferase